MPEGFITLTVAARKREEAPVTALKFLKLCQRCLESETDNGWSLLILTADRIVPLFLLKSSWANTKCDKFALLDLEVIRTHPISELRCFL